MKKKMIYDGITKTFKEIPDLTDEELIESVKKLSHDIPLTEEQLKELKDKSH